MAKLNHFFSNQKNIEILISRISNIKPASNEDATYQLYAIEHLKEAQMNLNMMGDKTNVKKET